MLKPSIFVLVLGLLTSLSSVADAAPSPTTSYVVVLPESVDPGVHANSYGITPVQTYESALTGYSAKLSASTVSRLEADGRVVSVMVDRVLPLRNAPPNTDLPAPDLKHNQMVPTGVKLVGALDSPTARIDGRDQRLDVDVAVLETGLDANHPDLNVVATKNCTGKKYLADNHGTHVAGIIGARDNSFGVVGVAPGARIWSVKFIDPVAPTTVSSLMCAMDYVLMHSDKIDVVNMSAGFLGDDDGGCGIDPPDFFLAAICELRSRGILLAASAGNGSEDAEETLPAAYDEVVAVSAISDYDGRPGGLSPVTCFDGGADDRLAWYSNFGRDVDIAAPGTCILSSWWPKPAYEYEIGTSMSAPHVAGAIALYLAGNPGATADATEAAILQSATPGPIAGDTDGYPEPLLDVSGF